MWICLGGGCKYFDGAKISICSCRYPLKNMVWKSVRTSSQDLAVQFVVEPDAKTVTLFLDVPKVER